MSMLLIDKNKIWLKEQEMDVFDSARSNVSSFVNKSVGTGTLTVEGKGSQGIKNASSEVDNSVPDIDSAEQMKVLADNLNKVITPLSTKVKFEYGEDIHGLYINVIDTNTDSVIRRFPSEDAVKLAIHMKEITGMIFDKKI